MRSLAHHQVLWTRGNWNGCKFTTCGTANTRSTKKGLVIWELRCTRELQLPILPLNLSEMVNRKPFSDHPDMERGLWRLSWRTWTKDCFHKTMIHGVPENRWKILSTAWIKAIWRESTWSRTPCTSKRCGRGTGPLLPARNLTTGSSKTTSSSSTINRLKANIRDSYMNNLRATSSYRKFIRWTMTRRKGINRKPAIHFNNLIQGILRCFKCKDKTHLSPRIL